MHLQLALNPIFDPSLSTVVLTKAWLVLASSYCSKNQSTIQFNLFFGPRLCSFGLEFGDKMYILVIRKSVPFRSCNQIRSTIYISHRTNHGQYNYGAVINFNVLSYNVLLECSSII